ncbi:NrsF family protein [Paracoccus sp. JM45]|uniref:NrsF family protein n=1 Tax=Paracoccus sp. JM45 TaxID=2283626 RepID=UPI000E6CE84A|nr:DUF1109 domain-containing protein [Paracoccus sp. JM45]RJE80737.1 DUF1109 family protein [Paracoccus sp. JM45]
MKTEELLNLIASDDVSDGPLTPKVLGAGVAMLAVFGGLVLAVLGIRPDLVQAIMDPVTAMKWVIPLVLTVVAAGAAIRLTRPQTTTLHFARGVIFSILIAAAVWWLTQAVGLRPEQVETRSMGGTAMICLSSISLISIPTLAVVMYLLRAGASPAPALSGAMAGLSVAGAATAIYALHCNEDTPLFFILWYGLGMSIVTAAGAWAGRRFLRW